MDNGPAFNSGFSNWDFEMDGPAFNSDVSGCVQPRNPAFDRHLIVNCVPPFLRLCVHSTGLRVGCGANESASSWSVSAQVSAGNLHVCSRD